MTSVLITRDLQPDDPLISDLREIDFQLTGVSFIEFGDVAFTEVPDSDWIFFYSRKAVQFFFNQLRDVSTIRNRKIAAIGQSTANEILQIGIPVNFIGKGQPDSVGSQFIHLAKGQTVLFPRARNSRNSIKEYIKDNCRCLDLVVYENNIIDQVLRDNFQVIIFTSPMNVEGFFKMNKLFENAKVISIGPPTTEKLKEFNVPDIEEMEEPGMDRLVELLGKL